MGDSFYMLILFEWLVARFFISVIKILHSDLNNDRITKWYKYNSIENTLTIK